MLAAGDFTRCFKVGDDDVDFLLQFGDKLCLRNLADHFAVTEQQSLTTGTGDADIGFTGFSGAVNGAAQHRYFDRHLQLGNILLYFVRDGEEVNVQAVRRSDTRSRWQHWRSDQKS